MGPATFIEELQFLGDLMILEALFEQI